MLAASLPDLDSLDLEAMKALLIAQHDGYTRTLSSRATEIERLTMLVAKLQHMLFGRKSEKVLRQIEQLEFQIGDLVVASAIEEAQAVALKERPLQAKPFRRPLPEHLPREIHTHKPGHEACPDCGGRLRELGEDVAKLPNSKATRAGAISLVPARSCVVVDLRHAWKLHAREPGHLGTPAGSNSRPAGEGLGRNTRMNVAEGRTAAYYR